MGRKEKSIPAKLLGEISDYGDAVKCNTAVMTAYKMIDYAINGILKPAFAKGEASDWLKGYLDLAAESQEYLKKYDFSHPAAKRCLEKIASLSGKNEIEILDETLSGRRVEHDMLEKLKGTAKRKMKRAAASKNV